MVRTVSHVVDAQAVQWYAGFRNGIHALQKVDMRREYLLGEI
jgi:hypothetical protein